MTQQAELLEKIDTLPPEYFGEVLLHQDLDAVWDNLERLAPNELAAMRGTAVPINLGDKMTKWKR